MNLLHFVCLTLSVVTLVIGALGVVWLSFPADLSLMALPPCHMFCQFYVHDGELSCQVSVCDTCVQGVRSVVAGD